jgi:glycosyltransferase involved in cell wall biosynthesis
MASQTVRTAPLHLSFVITSLPVGGAETLLVNLVKRLDRERFEPQVICLKQPGALGEKIAQQVTLHSGLLCHKYDFRVLPRLVRIFRQQQTDAVITVGAGDKMFWGRLAARLASVPVICSALHSTGWPDGVSRLNRSLTPITDGFIACAQNHAAHLVNEEGFPKSKVFMIPNGVDVERFRPNAARRSWLRNSLKLASDVKLVGIVAALREEKNHQQLILAAREVLRNNPHTHFVLVGDGPMRVEIEESIAQHGLGLHFHLLGSRSDTQDILAGLDVFVLTSKNEANPVSILEALASGVPVVSPRVGSIPETVIDEFTGLLTTPLDWECTADGITRLLENATWARLLGQNGRAEVAEKWSLEAMVSGYENLILSLYNAKSADYGRAQWGGTCYENCVVTAEKRAIPTLNTALEPTELEAVWPSSNQVS